MPALTLALQIDVLGLDKQQPVTAVARLDQVDLVAGGIGVLLARVVQRRAAGATGLGPMNTLRVDRQLLRAAISRVALAPSWPTFARIAPLWFFQVGLFFALFSFFRLVIARPIGSAIRRRIPRHIVLRAVVLRGLFGFLPRSLGTRRAGTVRRVPVQSVMRFLQIR